MSQTVDADVAIVGGGPVGLALAISLAQRNVSTIVLERHKTPLPIPRGQNLTQRTMEHFHVWGIEPALRAARTIPPDYGIGGMTAYGSLLGSYHYDWMRRELVRPFYYTDNERLPQYATETVLRRRLAEFSQAETRFGVTCTGITQDAEGVTVQAANAAGEALPAIRTRYAVGCDGARSLVRREAGLNQTLSDHDRLMVLLVFQSDALNRLLARYPGKSFYCVLKPELEGYWNFFGRVDLEGRFFFHAPVPAGTQRDKHDFAPLLHAAVGESFDFTLEHVGFWDLRFAVTERYGHGRLFIAGDAAHSHPPYGGYGINTGFEDAVNLAWKLAATLQGWAGPGLLDSYSLERQPVFASTAADFIEKSILTDRDFLAAHDPAVDRAAFEAAWEQRSRGAVGEVHSFAPRYEASPIIAGRPGGETSAKGDHAVKARAGHHLTPLVLADGRNVFEALSPGFTLLALAKGMAHAPAFAAAAAHLGMPLTLLAMPEAGAAQAYEADLVLVRPDQYVAWAGDDPAPSPEAILARAIGAAPAA